MFRFLRLALSAVGLIISYAGAASAQDEGNQWASEVEAVAALPGEPSSFSAGGLTRANERILTIERTGSFEGPGRRLVVVGGLEGGRESARAVLAALRWFKTDAPAALRREWTISAMPCAYPERCGSGSTGADESGASPQRFPPEDGFYNDETAPESRYVWRWVAFQAPDLVLEVRSGQTVSWEISEGAAAVRLDGPRPPSGSLAAALSLGTPSGLAPVAAVRASTSIEGAPEMLSSLLDAASSLGPSPLHSSMLVREARTPLQIASVLANRYPESPSMSYIPSVAWSNTLRLAARLGDAGLVEKVRSQMAPFLSGETPTIAEPNRLTSLAGHFAFADFSAPGRDSRALVLAIAGAEFILGSSPDEIVRSPTGWTDDMFMASSVLARIGGGSGDVRYGATVGRLLTSYAERLQREDGLYMHALGGPHAWGRGNGFALLGPTEALTYLPEDWPERQRVLGNFRRHVEALARHQAPDGMWRQVLDEPGSYREVTVTAMTIVAMARGVRLGWLDESYRPVVERAWRGLSAHIAIDGSLVDVCIGTGAQETRQYYLDRTAIFGPDDRGGAMALWAAMEVDELRGQS